MAHDDCPQSIGSTFTAAADLSSNQFYVVGQAGSSTVNLASTPGGGGLGILRNKPASGEAAEVCIGGVTLAVAGAAFTAGDSLTNDSAGRLVRAVADDEVIAEAAEDASGVDEIVSVVVLLKGAGSEPLRLTDSGSGIAANRFVGVDTGQAYQAEGGDNAVGVTESAVVAGATATIKYAGTATVDVGGEALLAGDLVGPDANGKADNASTGNACGVALADAAQGSTVLVLLFGPSSTDYIVANAAADYSSVGEGLAMVIDSSGEAEKVTTAGAYYSGVLLNDPAAGEIALVGVQKQAEVVSGAAFNAGAKLACDSAGKFVTAVDGDYSGMVAQSDATGADEEIATVLLGSIPVAGAWHCMTFSRAGALGTATIAEDVEFPIAMTTRRCYVKLGTAPGGGKSCVLTVGTKTVTISGADTMGENESMDEAIAKDTDFDVDVVDDGAGADLLATLWVQETNPK